MQEYYIEIVRGYRVDLDCHTYKFVVYDDPHCNNIIFESKRYISKDECKKEFYNYIKDKDYHMIIGGLTDINDVDEFVWE